MGGPTAYAEGMGESASCRWLEGEDDDSEVEEEEEEDDNDDTGWGGGASTGSPGETKDTFCTSRGTCFCCTGTCWRTGDGPTFVPTSTVFVEGAAIAVPRMTVLPNTAVTTAGLMVLVRKAVSTVARIFCSGLGGPAYASDGEGEEDKDAEDEDEDEDEAEVGVGVSEGVEVGNRS